MLTTDEIFYNILKADEDLMAATKGRIYNICIETSPYEKDKTPLPYIIVMYDGMTNDQDTKDDEYEGDTDNEIISIEVAALSREDVGNIMQKIRLATHRYMKSHSDEEGTPSSYDLSASGVAWDWTKPCYYQRLIYNCSTKSEL